MEQREPTLNDYTTIKTYEDACVVLGLKPIDEVGLTRVGVDSHIIALMKLETISRALWGLDFEPITDSDLDNEYWFSWWFYYTKEDIDEIKIGRLNRPAALVGGIASYGALAGFGFLHTDYRPAGTTAYIGFRLCQETEEKAMYFGVQFAELWTEYLAYNFQITERLI